LITELNEKHSADLATEINFSRGGPEVPHTDEPAILIVGNSHTSFLATAFAALGYKTVVIEMRPWWPNSMTVNKTKSELESKLAATRNVVAIVFWCLDNAAYYSITEDSILPAVRDVSGKHHIHGSLIISPSEMFSKSVKACAPLFSTATSAKKILLSPLPRYWHARCCDDEDHVANLDEPGFKNELFSGLDGLRRIMKDSLHTSNVRDITIYNTTQISTDGSRTTSIDTREALAIMWGDYPVHPARDCYESLAEHLQTTLQTQSEPTASTASKRPLKRPRWLKAEASNTVAPRDPSRGRGRGSNTRGIRGFRGRRRH
jgi:hypothetical protein